MDQFTIEIGMYGNKMMKINMSYEEYVQLRDYFTNNPQSNDLRTFDVHNGAGEITLRPDDIMYILY